MKNKYFILILLALICITATSCNSYVGYVVTNANDTIRGNFKLVISVSRSAIDSEAKAAKIAILAELPPNSSVPASMFKHTAPVAMFTVHTTKRTTTDIQLSNIKNIYIINKKGKDTLTYIYDGTFWQLLSAKNDFSIYMKNYTVCSSSVSFLADGTPSNGENCSLYENIVLSIGNKRKILIYNGGAKATFTVKKHQNRPNAPAFGILKFIDTIYNQNFSIDNFQNEKAMYDYILNKETALNDTASTPKWTLLAAKGNIKICHRFYIGQLENPLNISMSDGSNSSEDIAIFSGKEQKAMIYSGNYYPRPLRKRKIAQEVLQFINTRYHLNLTNDELVKYIIEKDKFEDWTKLFDFILAQETELGNGKN